MLRPANRRWNNGLRPNLPDALHRCSLILGGCLLMLGATLPPTVLHSAEHPSQDQGLPCAGGVAPVVMDWERLPQTSAATSPPAVPAENVDQTTRTPLSSATPSSAARLLSADLRPGSLILHQGDCLAVKIYTRSRFTHVGVLLTDEAGEWQVYDSANGHGVRKMSLENYLQCQPEQVLTVYHPSSPLTPTEQQRLQSALEEHLGRPYSVKHFLSGEPVAGLHCSEYACCALMAIPLVTVERPARVSPASLLKGLERGDLYRAGISVNLLSEPPPPPLESPSWCGRLWADTKNCTSGWWNRCFRAVTCRE